MTPCIMCIFTVQASNDVTEVAMDGTLYYGFTVCIVQAVNDVTLIWMNDVTVVAIDDILYYIFTVHAVQDVTLVATDDILY